MAELTLPDLQRWEDNGATWRVLRSDDERVVIELCSCSGEPVDQVEGRGPALIAYVRSRQPA